MSGRMRVKLGMENSPPDDQQVQGTLIVGESYDGLGIYKSHSVRTGIGGSGKTSQHYIFEQGGDKREYTAQQVLQKLNP